jgi:hypothetical protein
VLLCLPQDYLRLSPVSLISPNKSPTGILPDFLSKTFREAEITTLMILVSSFQMTSLTLCQSLVGQRLIICVVYWYLIQ